MRVGFRVGVVTVIELKNLGIVLKLQARIAVINKKIRPGEGSGQDVRFR